eukprot:1490688-Karenia_brevis.AAC.1
MSGHCESSSSTDRLTPAANSSSDDTEAFSAGSRSAVAVTSSSAVAVAAFLFGAFSPTSKSEDLFEPLSLTETSAKESDPDLAPLACASVANCTARSVSA